MVDRIFLDRLDILTVEECYEQAVAAGSEYFGLQHFRLKAARCWINVDPTKTVDSHGESQSCYFVSGWVYSPDLVNAVYAVNPDQPGDPGCVPSTDCPARPTCSNGDEYLITIPNYEDECCPSYICQEYNIVEVPRNSCSLSPWEKDADPVQYELGSYFTFYDQAVIEPELVYRDDASVMPAPLDSSCGEYDPHHNESSGSFALILVWIVFMIGGLYAQFRFRHTTMVKTRSATLDLATTVMTTIAVLVMSVITGAGDTAPCFLHLFFALCVLPAVLALCALKCMYLFFKYRWSQVRYTMKFAACEFYNTRRHYLAPKFIATIIACVLAVGLFFVFTIRFAHPETFTMGVSTLDSTRCSWWHLTPEHAQVLADLGVEEKFPWPVDRVYNKTDPESWTATYALHTDSCHSCLSVHGGAEGFSFFICLSLLVLVSVCTAMVLPMRDCHGLWLEIIAGNAVFLPLGFIGVLNMSAQTSLNTNGIAVLSISIFWDAFWSLYMPVLLALYYAGRLPDFPTFDDLISLVPPEGAFSLGAWYRKLSVKTSGGAAGKGGRDAGVTLEAVLADKEAVKLFKRFTVGDFSSENVDFLLSFRRLQTQSGPAVKHEANSIYQTFFRENAPLQVSVSREHASPILAFFSQSDIDAVTPKLFQGAADEVESRVLLDTWPRFIKSAYYRRVAMLLGHSDFELEDMDTALLSDDDDDLELGPHSSSASGSGSASTSLAGFGGGGVYPANSFLNSEDAPSRSSTN